MSAAMVLLSAYCVVTGMVGTDSLISAMTELVPPYRTQHIAGQYRRIAGRE